MKVHRLIFYFFIACVIGYSVDTLISKILWSIGSDGTYVRNQIIIDIAEMLYGKISILFPALFVGWSVPVKPFKAAFWLGLLLVAIDTGYSLATYSTDYHYQEWLALTPLRALFLLTAFVAFAFTASVVRRDYLPPNNSFKPNPLRGSA